MKKKILCCKFVYNIIKNFNRFDAQFWNSTRDVYKSKIDATYNYWNWNETLAVSSRIRDKAGK
jgi:hypothetical protein